MDTTARYTKVAVNNPSAPSSTLIEPSFDTLSSQADPLQTENCVRHVGDDMVIICTKVDDICTRDCHVEHVTSSPTMD